MEIRTYSFTGGAWSSEPVKKQIKVSYSLVAVVALLSLERLTRKLLRLA